MSKIRLSRLDLKARLADAEEYEAKLKHLQLKMLAIQQTYYHQKLRGIVVVEGWDAAGKGGLIRRMAERLDPRGLKVWPIGPPEEKEQGRHYLFRFWSRLPEPGTLAVFDRSWYGRVLVERVEGFARKSEWKRAYHEINEFERMLIDDGVRLVKVFLHITPEEQRERFTERLNNPYKRWKLTPEDIRNHRRWDDYVTAIEEMFDRTSTKAAPWAAIPANQKWYGRITALKHIAEILAADLDLSPPPVDPAVAELALGRLGAGKDKKRKNE